MRPPYPLGLALGLVHAVLAQSLASGQLTGVTWSGETVALYPDGQGNVIGNTGSTDMNFEMPDGG